MTAPRYILVAGGAGYIGSHTCKQLALAGYVPVVYDSLENGHAWAVRWGPLEVGNILDQARLEAVLERYRPEAVLHFAAYAYVGESVTDPARYYHNNVAGTLVLLEAMRACGVMRIVFSSTCATYGVPATALIDENCPQQPINPYGASKLMVERMLADFQVAYGLQWVALRYFNAAGADPQGELGEMHDPETHLLPLIIQAALDPARSITVFGSDYPTADGTCIRDYIHVTDLADAHILALQSLQQGGASGAFNLGNGQGFSVREVIDSVRRISGRDIRIVTGERRAGDPPALVGNAARARHALGWTPRYADLDTIVSTAWAWHQAQQSRPVSV